MRPIRSQEEPAWHQVQLPDLRGRLLDNDQDQPLSVLPSERAHEYEASGNDEALGLQALGLDLLHWTATVSFSPREKSLEPWGPTQSVRWWSLILALSLHRSSTMGDFALLRSMPVFGGLKDRTLEHIVNHSQRVRIPKAAYFFRTGDEADAAYVLNEGVVAIERLWNEQPIVLGHLHRGDCVGEMALLDLMPRSASARAEEDCVATKITQHDLVEIYKQDPEQYAIIMMNMGREVSRRLRKADDRLFELIQTMAGLG